MATRGSTRTAGGRGQERAFAGVSMREARQARQVAGSGLAGVSDSGELGATVVRSLVAWRLASDPGMIRAVTFWGTQAS